MTNKQINNPAPQSDLFASEAAQPVLPTAAGGGSGCASAAGWSGPQRVFIDLELTHLAIAATLDRHDDAAIWCEYRRAPDQVRYLDWLSNQAGCYSFMHTHSRDSSRQTTSNIMLTAVPYLLPASSVPAASCNSDRAVLESILRGLQAWVGLQQHATVVEEPVSYLELCRWSPLTQRERLLALSGRKPGRVALLTAPQVQLPADFPVLSFLIVGVRRWLAHPELPEPGLAGGRDWALRSQLAAHLTYLHRQPAMDANDMRLPMPFAAAVLEGLRMWIAEVGRLGLANRWDLRVRHDDLLLLELGCPNPKEPTLILPLRRHQIGAYGLDLLVQDLKAEIGPLTATERASA